MLLQLRIVAGGRRPLERAIFAMPEEASQRNGTSCSGDWLLVGSVSRNKTPPPLIYFAEGKLNRSTK
jgi:hypothetical protein